MEARLTPEQRKEVAELYQAGEDLGEIAKGYGVSKQYVSYTALRAGCTPRKVHSGRKPKLSLDDQIAAADAELEKAKVRRAELERLKQAKGIKFEWIDEGVLAVHGVTDKFVVLGGMAKLLEFIEHSIPQKKVNGSAK